MLSGLRIALALSLAGCASDARFARACGGLATADANRDEVDALLVAGGAHHTIVGESDVWVRETLLEEATCEVDFDGHGRARAALYHRER
jgi:hypothetical protein